MISCLFHVIAINFICSNRFCKPHSYFYFYFCCCLCTTCYRHILFCCFVFAVNNFSLASGASIFTDHTAYFFTDIETIVVKNTHRYWMLVNTTGIKSKINECFEYVMKTKGKINEWTTFYSYMTSADVNVFGIFDLINSKTVASIGSLAPASDAFSLCWTFPSENTIE